MNKDHHFPRVRRGLALAGFITLLTLLRPAGAQQPAATKSPTPVLSVPPAELLKLLPPAPEAWKLTASTGFSELTTEPSTRTFVVRDYLSLAPPDAVPTGSPPPAPAKTRLTLVDTGFDPTMLSGFKDFKPDAAAVGKNDSRRFLWEGHPAMFVTRRSGKQVLTVSLASRFNVIIETEHQPDTAIKAWSDRLDLAALTQAAVSASRSPLPAHTVVLARVDEFNPKANSTQTETYLTTEEGDAYRRSIQSGPVAHPGAH